MDRWLNACVGMERAFNIVKGPQFDKKKSKRVAKYIILILTLLMMITNIHDPIHRRLLDDGNDYDDDKRIWCIISYSSRLQTFNTFLNMFHFFVPFILNIISAVIIIVMTARQRTHVGNNKSYRRILREQLYEHWHLLIAPIILVILAVPSLIISLVSNCIKSSGNSWLFLFGYFVSFIPPTLCLVVFVLPSKLYKKELHKAIIDYGQKIRTQLHIT
jgi:Na+/proline symporter